MKMRIKGWVMAGLIVWPGIVQATSQVSRIDTPIRVQPIVIDGEVTIIIGSNGSPVISPYFNIKQGANPLRKRIVTLNGHALRETMPGQYAGIRITSISPRPGQTLTFSIESPKMVTPSPALRKTRRIEGRATIASMAAITQPEHGEILPPKILEKHLYIKWKGGLPPFRVSLVKTTGGSPLEIFTRAGALSRVCAVHTSLFVPGNTYSAVVSYKMDNFVIRLIGDMGGTPVSKSSTVILRYTVIRDFAVQNSR